MSKTDSVLVGLLLDASLISLGSLLKDGRFDIDIARDDQSPCQHRESCIRGSREDNRTYGSRICRQALKRKDRHKMKASEASVFASVYGEETAILLTMKRAQGVQRGIRFMFWSIMRQEPSTSPEHVHRLGGVRPQSALWTRSSGLLPLESEAGERSNRRRTCSRS